MASEKSTGIGIWVACPKCICEQTKCVAPEAITSVETIEGLGYIVTANVIPGGWCSEEDCPDTGWTAVNNKPEMQEWLEDTVPHLIQ